MRLRWLAGIVVGCSAPPTLSELPLPEVVVPEAPPEPEAPRRPRIGALVPEVYVRQSPRSASPEIGVVHVGRSLVRALEPVSKEGCPGGWYAVEPEGFVCNGEATTLEPTEPAHAGDFAKPAPYRWFESAGDALLYERKGDAPGRRLRLIGARSTVAVTHELGKHWVTQTNELVRRDSVSELVPSKFRGVRLGKVKLPIAFVRGEPKPKLRWEERDFVETGKSWPRLAWMELTGTTRVRRGKTYLETRSGDWIRESDATPVREEEPRGFELGENEKWIDVSIFRGTLVAYVGTKPVFATLISPGAHGYRRVDGKPGSYTTPTGTFRIEWKHRSTTMTPDPEKRGYTLAEVPWTQFFHMPFALHAAYWHDRFGEPKSGGCVNLSPADARFLFDWTEPRVPDDWHGVRSGGKRGDGTWVRIR